MHWKIACFPQVLLYVAVGFSLFAAEKKLANCTHTQNFFSVLFPFWNGVSFITILYLIFDDSNNKSNLVKNKIWICYDFMNLLSCQLWRLRKGFSHIVLSELQYLQHCCIKSCSVLPHIASDGNETLNFEVFTAEFQS